jgi:two-component system sensor histidine kinase GlrK
VRLILENLLSRGGGAPPRSGTIHIRGRADNGDLVLEVADSGPGIPAEERQQVFEAFYTGKAPSGHIKGTGIGLSVVLEFVNAHGGRIEIVDGQWPGAHFRIRMPLRATVEPIASAPRAPGSRAHAA